MYFISNKHNIFKKTILLKIMISYIILLYIIKDKIYLDNITKYTIYVISSTHYLKTTF